MSARRRGGARRGRCARSPCTRSRDLARRRHARCGARGCARAGARTHGRRRARSLARSERCADSYRHEAILRRVLIAAGNRWSRSVRAILSVALFELEDARTPDYAVVDAAVNTRQGRRTIARGLINALLRRYLRERESLEADIARSPAARHAAPEWLARAPARGLAGALDGHPGRLRCAGADVAARECRGTARRPIMSRRSARRESRRAAEPRVPQAVLLSTPRDVVEVPGFADGVVSVQDLGAQCVAFPLALEPGPAGARRLRGAWRKDRAHRRARAAPRAAGRARHRCAGASSACARTSSAAASRPSSSHGDAASPEGWWDGMPFDRILLDAPCSALGVIRRHPDIRLRRSPQEHRQDAALQGRLLDAAWRHARARAAGWCMPPAP